MKGLDFVAVVYNNYLDTLDFCKSVEINRKSFDKINCYLIDNSDDEFIINKIHEIAEEFEFVKVLRPPKNLGYFGGFNYFFKSEFFNSKNDVLLCNNDLIFHDDFVLKYLSSSYDDDVLVVCPDVITIDGYHQNPHVKNRMGIFWKLKLDIYYLNYNLASMLVFLKKLLKFKRKFNIDESCYIHMGIGACYILNEKFFRNFDFLEYPHFLYGEEAYFSNQVYKMGGRMYFHNDLKVQHKESATLSKLPSRITYNFAKAGYRNYRKYL